MAHHVVISGALLLDKISTKQIKVVVPAIQIHFQGPFLHISRMTISVTVDTIIQLHPHLSTMSMIHYGMVLGVFEALAVSSTLLLGSVRTYLTLPLKT